MKYKVRYMETGADAMGCHPGEWMNVGAYHNPEEATRALEDDMKSYVDAMKEKYGDEIEELFVDDYEVRVSGSDLYAKCEWDIVKEN